MSDIEIATSVREVTRLLSFVDKYNRQLVDRVFLKDVLQVFREANARTLKIHANKRRWKVETIISGKQLQGEGPDFEEAIRALVDKYDSVTHMN